MSVPSILEDIVRLPESTGAQKLAKLDFVAFGGGSMKPAVGHSLTSAGVRLLNHFGTTESGPLAPIFIPDLNYDWQYFRLRQDIELRVEPTSTSIDDDRKFRLITYPPGWDEPFEIQDEFVTSSRNSMIDFAAVGRKDSVIVLATGEKVQPTTLETMLNDHPLVMAAIAFGEGRFQLGIIVQPSHTTPSGCFGELKASIWPTILEANEHTDAHARIDSKDAIIIVPYATMLPRSDKGSLLRRELYAMLESEIEQVYQQLESAYSVTDGQTALDRNGDIKRQLKDLIQHTLPNWNVPVEDWTVWSDLFELGMDSLQAVELRRLLLPNMESAEAMPRDFVYRHPSIVELAEAIEATYHHLKPDESADVRQELVHGFVEQFSLRTQEQGNEEEFVVLLTGSTGSLGCHLVVHLANLPKIMEVICLIRPSTGHDGNASNRQDEALHDKLLHLPPKLRAKVTTIQAVLSRPQLGLTSEAYNSIVQRVTHVLHNAWPMNFKWRLSSFQSQFQIVQNLLTVAVNARTCRQRSYRRGMCRQVRFVFVSSIAVVGEHTNVHERSTPVPEKHVSDITSTNQIGYAEAKMVCEKIIERAGEDFATDLETACVRVGQMSGSMESGFWNTDEHIPALLRSSVTISAIPVLEGVSTATFILPPLFPVMFILIADTGSDTLLATS